MKVGKIYKVTKQIKMHTKPLITAEIEQTGVFVKETAKNFVFKGFRVSKSTIIKFEEVDNYGG